MNRIELHLPRNPGPSRNARIRIDGHDVARTVSHIEVHSGVGSLTTVRLDLAIVEAVDVDGHARVVLEDDVVQLLMRHGWRPPNADMPTVLPAAGSVCSCDRAEVTTYGEDPNFLRAALNPRCPVHGDKAYWPSQ